MAPQTQDPMYKAGWIRILKAQKETKRKKIKSKKRCMLQGNFLPPFLLLILLKGHMLLIIPYNSFPKDFCAHASISVLTGVSQTCCSVRCLVSVSMASPRSTPAFWYFPCWAVTFSVSSWWGFRGSNLGGRRSACPCQDDLESFCRCVAESRRCGCSAEGYLWVRILQM